MKTSPLMIHYHRHHTVMVLCGYLKYREVKLYVFKKNTQSPRSIIPATGSRRKNAGKSPDPSGKHGKYLEHGSSISVWIFPMISGRILSENTGSCRNPQEKIREIPDRNTASNFLIFSVENRPFPAVRHSPGQQPFLQMMMFFSRAQKISFVLLNIFTMLY